MADENSQPTVEQFLEREVSKKADEIRALGRELTNLMRTRHEESKTKLRAAAEQRNALLLQQNQPAADQPQEQKDKK